MTKEIRMTKQLGKFTAIEHVATNLAAVFWDFWLRN
jgi:hypothetical protein